MKSRYFYTYVVLLWFIPLGILAQDVTIQFKATVPMEFDGYNYEIGHSYDPEKADSLRFVLVGSDSIGFCVSVDQKKYQLKELKYQREDTSLTYVFKKDESFILLETLLGEKVEAVNENGYRIKFLDLTLLDTTTDTERDIIVDESYCIYVTDKPTVTFTGVENSMWSGNTALISSKSTNPLPNFGQWIFFWSEDGTLLSDTLTSIWKKQMIKEGVHNVSVLAKYILADEAKTTWLEYSFSHDFVVYPEPAVSVSAMSNNLDLKKNVGPDNIYVYNGFDEKIVTMSVLVEGGKNDSWAYSWTIDGISNGFSDKSDCEYDISAGNAKITVNVVNRLEKRDTTFQKTFNVFVYDDDDFVATAAVAEVDLLDGMETWLDVECKKAIGSVQTEIDWWGEHIVAENQATCKIIGVYDRLSEEYGAEVTWKGPDGDEWKRDTVSYSVYLYPQISVERMVKYNDSEGENIEGNSVNCYFNTPIVLGYRSNYENNERTVLTVDVKKLSGSGANPVLLDGTTLYEISHNLSSNIQMASQSETKYRVSWEYKSSERNSILAEGTYDFTYVAWSTGTVDCGKFRYNVLCGDIVPIVVDCLGGYADGWSFSWVDEQGDELATTEKFEYLGTHSEREPLYRKLSLHAVNCIEDVIGLDTMLTFTVVEYPAFVKASYEGEIPRAREGDIVSFRIEPPFGGNPDGWKFQWSTSEGTLVKENFDGHFYESVFELGSYDSGNKYTESQICQLVYWNEDNSEVLIAADTLIMPVQIYRVPEKPDALECKGDGTSGIYIATYDSDVINQELLEARDYKFGFSYANSELQSGVQRYVLLTDEQKKDANLLSVWSYWEYEDGFICCSDTIKFGDTRMEPSGILTIENNSFYVSLNKEETVTVTIYSVTGTLVKVLTYPAMAGDSEKVYLNDIPKGIYIIHCDIGTHKIVEKIVNR